MMPGRRRPASDALPFLMDVHGPGVRRSLAHLSRIADRSFRLLGHVSFDATGPDRYRMRFEREAVARRIAEEGVTTLSEDLRHGFEAFVQGLRSARDEDQDLLPLEASMSPIWRPPDEQG